MYKNDTWPSGVWSDSRVDPDATYTQYNFSVLHPKFWGISGDRMIVYKKCHINYESDGEQGGIHNPEQ